MPSIEVWRIPGFGEGVYFGKPHVSRQFRKQDQMVVLNHDGSGFKSRPGTCSTKRVSISCCGRSFRHHLRGGTSEEWTLRGTHHRTSPWPFAKT